jgi:hypothetical protein
MVALNEKQQSDLDDMLIQSDICRSSLKVRLHNAKELRTAIMQKAFGAKS